MQGSLTTPADVKPLRRRHWLVYLLHTLWFAAAVLTVEVLLLSLRPGWAWLSTVCTEPPCAVDQVTPAGLEALAALGLSVQGYALFNLVLVLTVALIYCGVAVIIFWARPNEPIAIYTTSTPRGSQRLPPHRHCHRSS